MTEEKWEKDVSEALQFIKNHALRDKIVSMYTTGPPKDEGFVWWKNDTPEFKAVEDFVLDMGYDSSAYVFMHRSIQHAVREMCNFVILNGEKDSAAEEKKMAAESDENPSWAPVIAEIKGALHRQMVTGFIPKDPKGLMNILKGIPVTQKQVYKLALGNKLEWIYAMGMEQSPEEYQQEMNKAMAHYLKEAVTDMDPENRKAAEVWQEKGHEAAGAYMMEQAGGDYSRMRSMFG
jgi:hypothetical protein